MQLSLIQDTTIKKSIINVEIKELSLSKFNPRYTCDDEDIDKLAQRISRNGFEITRALWVYKNGNGYKVFAGGTRLEAARRAGCKSIPCVIHEGLEDDDIVRLADEDNENDEYHAEVSPVNKWQQCSDLKESGWEVPRIAAAKSITERMVYHFLKLHKLPAHVKEFCTQKLLEETHLREITSFELECTFSPWLTPEQAWIELAEKAVYDKGKNGNKSVKAVKADVDTWKAFITEAEAIYNNLPESTTLYDLEQSPPTVYAYNPKEAFIQELTSRSARSLTAVKAAGRAVQLNIKENLEAYEMYITQQSADAGREALKAEREAKLLARFTNGDCLEISDNWQWGPIRLLFIDPPYGKEYKSNRRWASRPADKIQGDEGQEALDLLKAAIEKALPHTADDFHALVFCDWEREPAVRGVLAEAGLRIKGSLIWVKEEHSAGDIKGAFGPSHERIIHAVKGSPEVTPRIRDVLEYARSRETPHPNEKPLPLIEKLILSTTQEGDLVVDLFAGCGPILLVAMKLKREFFGTEIDQNYHEFGSARLLKELENDS